MAGNISNEAQSTPPNASPKSREKDVSDGILELLLTTAQIEENEKVNGT